MDEIKYATKLAALAALKEDYGRNIGRIDEKLWNSRNFVISYLKAEIARGFDTANLDYIPQKFYKDKKILSMMVAINYNDFARRVKSDDKKVLLAAIKIRPEIFMDLPHNLRCDKQMLAAVSSVCPGLGMEYLPEHKKTKRLCNKAVKDYPLNLQYVPEKKKTKDMCLAAVKSDGSALKYVPKKWITPEICRVAVESNALDLKYVPEGMKSKKLCEIAVAKNPNAVKYITQNAEFAYDLFLKSVKAGAGLDVVPERYKSEEICKIAVAKNPNAVKYIPQNAEFAYDLFLKSIKAGVSLDKVPEMHRSEEICKIAVVADPSEVKYIPADAKWAGSFCDELCKVNIDIISRIPKGIVMSEGIYVKAMEHNISLGCVPENARTERVCLKFLLENDKSTLNLREVKGISRDVLDKARIIKSGVGINDIDAQHFRSKAFCEELLSRERKDALAFIKEQTAGLSEKEKVDIGVDEMLARKIASVESAIEQKISEAEMQQQRQQEEKLSKTKSKLENWINGVQDDLGNDS